MTKRRVTSRELKRLKEMGTKALAKYKKEHPESQALHPMTHGARSVHIRKRYSDARTKEGKQLRDIMDGLIRDLGGHGEISTAQRLLLDNIRSNLIVLLQISKYADRQASIISTDGELLPCLGRNLLLIRRLSGATWKRYVRQQRSPKKHRT